MKTTIQLIALSIFAALFTSCAGYLPDTANQGKVPVVKQFNTGTANNTKVQSSNNGYVTNNYSNYQKRQSAYSQTRNVTVYSAKGDSPAPVLKTVKVKHVCTKCGSFYCPRPNCCGIVNNAVLSRATGQSGTGEPPIGLIPTMKTLAPDLKK